MVAADGKDAKSIAIGALVYLLELELGANLAVCTSDPTNSSDGKTVPKYNYTIDVVCHVVDNRGSDHSGGKPGAGPVDDPTGLSIILSMHAVSDDKIPKPVANSCALKGKMLDVSKKETIDKTSVRSSMLKAVVNPDHLTVVLTHCNFEGERAKVPSVAVIENSGTEYKPGMLVGVILAYEPFNGA